MKKYVETITGYDEVFTERKMKKMYSRKVDKLNYPNYELWLCEVLQNGSFKEVK